MLKAAALTARKLPAGMMRMAVEKSPATCRRFPELIVSAPLFRFAPLRLPDPFPDSVPGNRIVGKPKKTLPARRKIAGEPPLEPLFPGRSDFAPAPGNQAVTEAAETPRPLGKQLPQRKARPYPGRGAAEPEPLFPGWLDFAPAPENRAVTEPAETPRPAGKKAAGKPLFRGRADWRPSGRAFPTKGRFP